MKRREFLRASAALAGAGLVESGCGNSPEPKAIEQKPAVGSPTPQAAAAPPAPTPPAGPQKGIQVLFHGLTLFAMPTLTKAPHIDVAFINTRANPALPVPYHAPTLKVRRDQVADSSTARPAAADLDFAYYAVSGPMQIVPTQTDKPGEALSPPTENLKWRDDPLADLSPKDCPQAPIWNNMRWLLNFTDLYGNARLPPKWRDDRKLILGWIRLSHGFLETDEVPPDTNDRFTYSLNGKDRMLKDVVRYFMPPSAPFLQVRFGEGSSAKSLVIQCGTAAKFVGIDVLHVPTPGMDPNPADGKLVDYYAFYELLATKAELKQLADVAKRPTLSNKRRTCSGFTPKSGNCAGIRMDDPLP